ncbi:MAG: Gfo/Idh/MocA family protein [Anaerolineales bacterium]
MRFLIAGLGSIGRRHLRNLLALGEKDIILYRSNLSTLPDDELEGFQVETNLEDALAANPQAVIVANPTSLHLDVAIPAAEARCSILMEKPISHSLEGTDQLAQALKQHGGRFLSGFHFRYHPGLAQVKEWLSEGLIGEVVSVQSFWGEYLPGWHPWEDYRNSYAARTDLGGGVVNTLSHPFDYLRWMFGDVQDVQAVTSSNGLDLPVEDTADILLKFRSGCQAVIHLDYLRRPPRHTLEIIGTRGTITWDNGDGSANRFDVEKNEWTKVNPPPGFERNHLFLAEMGHFLKVARGEEQPRCSLEDGLAAVRIAQAVHQAATHTRLVELEY